MEPGFSGRPFFDVKARIAAAYYYRLLTSPFRRLPDFLIIGVQKAGTSSLYYYLAQHPQIGMSLEKELHYYNYHVLRGKGRGWYKSFFPLKFKSRGKITGEASPYYLFDGAAPARIKADIPNVKLIALLREPVDRAYSSYSMNKRQQQRADFPSFEDAIANEDMSQEESRLYLYRGRYAEHIRPWLACFPRDSILFVRSEEFFADPRAALDEVYDFLGVERIYPGDLKAQEVGRYPELAAGTRTKLEEYFRSANQELVELLGERFRW